jgi:hypothetical protein
MLFAGSLDEYNPQQLFIQTDWEPDPESIPIKFCARVSYFLWAVKAQFFLRQAQHNLTPFQHQLFLKLRNSLQSFWLVVVSPMALDDGLTNSSSLL